MKVFISLAVLFSFVLSISAQTPPCQCGSGYASRTIVAGDTCTTIANQYYMTVADLQWLNKAMVCDAPTVGTCICVPDAVPTQYCNWCPAGYTSRVINSGDTCWSIATYYGQTTAQLQAINPNAYCPGLPVGGCMCVPTSIALPQTCICGTGYTSQTIHPGDSCSSIATYYGISTNTLASTNPIMNCNNLLVNSCVCVPTNIQYPLTCSCPNGYVSRSVVSGDSCNQMASQYGISVAQLQAQNPYLNCNAPLINSCVCVPYGYSTPQVCSCTSGYVSRTVQPGETCAGIASQYYMTAAQLQSISQNNNIYCPNLPVYSCMCVPYAISSPQVCQCPNGYVSRTVQAGETCASIGSQYTLTAYQLQSINTNAYCPNLPVNSCLCVPYALSTPQVCNCVAGYVSRTVFAGDTCSGMAAAYGITLAQLQTANQNAYCANLPINSCLCVPATISAQTCSCGTGYTSRTIVPGDNCYTIAANYATTVPALSSYNQYMQCITPVVNSCICVPISIPAQTCSCPTGYYSRVVQAGDTCSGIASYYGITVSSLQSTSPYSYCPNLPVGSCMCVPSTIAPQTCSCGSGYYSRTIQPGDSCASLASYYQITTTQFTATNRYVDCNNLLVNSCVCVPASLASPQVCGCGTGYVSRTLTASDSCASLSNYYGLTQSQLIALNPSLYCTQPLVNSCICVPTSLPTPRTCSCAWNYVSHTIVQGETCTGIATASQTTVAQIQLTNPSLDCSQPLINSCVCVPYVAPCTCTTGTPRTVGVNENCNTIAAQYGITTTALSTFNNNMICPTTNLAYGQCLCIPPPAPTCTCLNGTPRVVLANENCNTIAAQYGITATTLSTYNNNMNCGVTYLTYGQCLCIPPPSTVSTTCGCTSGRSYTVQSGDWCDTIASKAGTITATLQSLNPTMSCSALKIGQCICLPALVSPPPVTTCSCSTGRYWTVKSGEYCDFIASNSGTTTSALTQYNTGLNCNALQIGQCVCLPPTTSTCRKYTIKSGDTCFALAQSYGTTVTNIQNLNTGLSCGGLQVGQVICV